MPLVTLTLVLILRIKLTCEMILVTFICINVPSTKLIINQYRIMIQISIRCYGVNFIFLCIMWCSSASRFRIRNLSHSFVIKCTCLHCFGMAIILRIIVTKHFFALVVYMCISNTPLIIESIFLEHLLVNKLLFYYHFIFSQFLIHRSICLSFWSSLNTLNVLTSLIGYGAH